MSVFRVNKNKNYTVLSNYHFRDKSLSLKAKGLLSQMLSLPDDWDYSVEGLVSINKESKTAIQSTLKELEECHYLKRTKTHDDKGRIDYIYDIYETPWTENPYTVNLCTETPCTENMPQLNTKEQSNKKLSTNTSNTKDSKGQSPTHAKVCEEKTKKKAFTPPSVQEVQAYCLERGNGINAEQFIDYYTARGWELSKGRKVKDWKACVRTWERNGYDTPTKAETQTYQREDTGGETDQLAEWRLIYGDEFVDGIVARLEDKK